MFFACCCGGSGGGPFPLAGCPCATVPAVLHVNVPTPGPSPFTSDASTLTYQARPADLTGYTSALTGWYGPRIDRTADRGYIYRYWFTCDQGVYHLLMLPTSDSPFDYGGKISVATWLVGLSGNTCTPFTLTNGGPAGAIFLQQGGNITS